MVNDTVKHLKRSKIKPDDLLMVFVGVGLGQVGIVPSDREYFLGPNVAMIRIESNYVLSEFFELFFRSPKGYGLTLSLSKATAQGSISMANIRQIPCAIPSIKEQQVIIETTEKLLSIIDETEKGVEAELKRSQSLQQSILKRAFEGKLVPQDPNDEPASALIERIKTEKAKLNN